MYNHVAPRRPMPWFSYTSDPNERQHDEDNSSSYAADSSMRTMQSCCPAIFMPSYSSQSLAPCEIFDPGYYEAENANKDFSNFGGQGVSLAVDDHYSNQNVIQVHEADCTPSFALRDGHDWPQQFHHSPRSAPYSPGSTEPCPRISRLNASGLFPRSQTPNIFPSNVSRSSALLHTYNQNESIPFRYSPSPLFGFNYPAGAHKVSWQVEHDSNAGRFDPEASPSAQLLSQSASPQSFYSDLSEERPHQRRRIAFSDSTLSSSSEAGSTSDTSLTTVSSTQRKSPNLPKARSSKNGRIKQTQPIISSNACSAFSTFSVNLTPAKHEPTGATYMSTVDFKTDTEHQAFEHGPTDLPPRPYIGGPEVSSPWKPRKNLGTIPGSALDYLPVIEDRMARLERALDSYLQYRGERAVQNSIVPGMDLDTCDDTAGCAILN